MAIVVLGGLLTAVVLNMLVVPALFLRYGVDRPGLPARPVVRSQGLMIAAGVLSWRAACCGMLP